MHVQEVRGIALRHEPLHAHGVPGRQQVVSPLGPQAVGQREIAIEVTCVNRPDRGQLVDDHVRLRPAHGLRDLIGIERVRDHRHRAQSVEHRLLGLAPRHAMNLMTGGNQQRHQVLPDRSGRSCHKHSHHQLPDRRLPAPTDKTAAPAVTARSTPARESGRQGQRAYVRCAGVLGGHRSRDEGCRRSAPEQGCSTIVVKESRALAGIAPWSAGTVSPRRGCPPTARFSALSTHTSQVRPRGSSKCERKRRKSAAWTHSSGAPRRLGTVPWPVTRCGTE